MVVTLLIVAGVATVYAGVLVALVRRWGWPASRGAAPAMRTSIDHDPDNRYSLMSGDSF